MQNQTSSAIDDQTVKAIVREYFVRLDGGRADLLDIFTDDAQFYFPKFGIGVGKAAFGELITGLLTRVAAISHDIPNLKYVVDGSMVAVEGTTRGRLQDGTEWSGGDTAGGRFASIFEVTGGRISRMHIYLDPDYGSQDKASFLWSDKGRRW
jgi:ketosteroid isomerase-like protein